MTATTYTRSGSAFVASNRLILIVYTVSIFVSALLLFSVQPLFTKMILPRLGGSPAVWSIAMVFFQSLLLFGYAYARTIRNRVIPVIVHLTLLIIALLTLPLAIGESWSSPPESGYALWLLGLFAVTIGLPFFALAANNPLLQAWFVRRPSRGTLARTRPPAQHLTGFYVALSFGGMVGGLFAGLIAPFSFSWVAEYPILLALCGFVQTRRPSAGAAVGPLVLARFFMPLAPTVVPMVIGRVK